MLVIKPEDQLRLIKRVKQILKEIDSSYIDSEDTDNLDTLAFRLKLIISPYNCFINSWVTTDYGGTYGCAECYNTADYIEEEDDTWELMIAESEPMVIVMSFKWLADRGYLTPETKGQR